MGNELVYAPFSEDGAGAVRDVESGDRSSGLCASPVARCVGMKEKWGALPLGELHPDNRCAWCGVKGEPMMYTVHKDTLAPCYGCIDYCACIRRRHKDAA